MPKIKLHLGIGFSNAYHNEVIHYDDDDWNALTPAAQEQTLEEIAQEWGSNYIDLSASIEE